MPYDGEYSGGLSVTMKIASSDVGKVIGRGGKKIRELEQAGGGRIKISSAPDENGMKTIDISGRDHEVEATRRMIEDFLKDFDIGDNAGKRGGFSGGYNHSKPVHNSRREGYRREDKNQDNGDKWGWHDEEDDKDFDIGDDAGKRGGFSGGYNHSKPVPNSRSEGYRREDKHQDNGDEWGWHEEEDEKDVSGGGRNGRSEGFGSGHGEDVYKSRSVYNSERRGQDHGDRWNRHEEDERADITSGSNGTRRGGFSGGHVNNSRGGGSSNRNYRGQDRQHNGDRRGSHEQYDKGSRSSGGNGQAVDSDNETISVISSDVGKIIGRGGSRIRELETDSGCRIKVSRAGGSSGQSQVELTGSKSAISEAKRLIQETGVEIVNASDHGQADAPVHSKDEGEYVSELKKRPLINWSALREKHKQQEKDRLSALPEILKDFYKEEAHIKNMPHEEVKQIRKENNNIIVDAPDGESECVLNPVRTFEDAFKHYPLILEQIKKQNFVKPSPIQCQSWPLLLQGKDLIGVAQTGTGKTLAFLLPALIHIDSQPIPRESRVGPSALILSPTRELAQQIELEVNKINYKGIRSICVYGGGNRTEQLKKVRKGVEIVVATPGRLNDFMMHGQLNVKNVTYLVMDEADRMLDLGFELEIKKVMLDIRPDRQTVMTSATWPSEVQKLAEQYMTKPYKVFVGTLDLAAVHSVTQHVEFVDEKDKKSALLDFISNMKEDDKLIVFVGRKMVADDVSSDLAMNNIECQCIHGDREQCDRETALEEFKNGTVRILVATDVASRGLDVKDITHVLNYDFPNHIEEYVHRIGRTGRAGRSGTALTFMTRNDWKNAQQLIDIMSEADQNIPDELVAMAERYSAFRQQGGDDRRGSGGRGGRGRGGRGRGGRGGRRNDDDVGNFWV